MKNNSKPFDLFKANIRIGNLTFKKGVCIAMACFMLIGCTKTPPAPVEEKTVVYKIQNPSDLLKPATGIVTDEATGEKIDLAKLKVNYGDLYYLVEPLTQKELETRFWNIVYLQKVINKENGIRRPKGLPLIDVGGYCIPADGDIFIKTLDEADIKEQAFIKKIKTSTDPKIVSYSMYYLNQFNQDKPSFVFSQELLNVLDEKSSVKLSNSEMNAYVSYYYSMQDISKSIYAKYKISTECIVCHLTVQIEKTK